MSDKTEEPTPKRLRKAREDGDTPQSAFASQAVGFVVAVALAPAALATLFARSSDAVRAAVAQAGEARPSTTLDALALGSGFVAVTVPLLAGVGLAGAVTSFVQGGGVFAPKRLAPDLSKLDPIAGLRKLVSLDRVVAVLRAALFGGAATVLAYQALVAHASELAGTTGDLARAGALAVSVARELVSRIAILGLFLGVLDIVIVRRQWLGRLRMSKDEVKREHKESEGDPELKAARERAHHEMMTSVTLANVREASVLVVNPTHLACALRYDETSGDEAPVLVASGEGALAARMVEEARRAGVPVLRDVPLARALIELEVGAGIPEALYEAVAEILRAAWDESDGSPG